MPNALFHVILTRNAYGIWFVGTGEAFSVSGVCVARAASNASPKDLNGVGVAAAACSEGVVSTEKALELLASRKASPKVLCEMLAEDALGVGEISGESLETGDPFAFLTFKTEDVVLLGAAVLT
jgi:hypothetical protein